MAAIFSQILNMTLTGSLVIGAVLSVRLCIRKLPKIFSYALWSVVLFRLLCPVSLSGPVSVLEFFKPQVRETSDAVSVVSYLPSAQELPEFQYVAADTDPGSEEEASDSLSLMQVLSRGWLGGCATMLAYGVIQYWQLRKRLIGATVHRGNVYLADHIDTAFVMGLFNPRIYLPSDVPSHERKYILAHERNHIRRGDHIYKLLAYVALCVHWFNPLVWVAFLLAGKDMEMSCDEAVIRRYGTQVRAEYSASLLRLAAHRKPVPGMPLAFGEGDTKGRIMNMAKWKKPKLWVSTACLVLCLAVLAACAVNPSGDQTQAAAETEAAREATADLSEENTNILFTCFSGDTASGVPDITFLLSVTPEWDQVTVATVLNDTYVSLPDYEGHLTGENRFSACYALGNAWGGTQGAEKMVNQCMLETFDVAVDHNLELTGANYAGIMDVLNGFAGKLEGELAPELLPLYGEILTLIAGDENAMQKAEEQLAKSAWGSCTLPFEGAYTVREVEIGGIKTDVLIITEEADTQQAEASAEYMPTVQGNDIASDIVLVQYDAFTMALSGEYESYAQDGSVILTKGGVPVGGIKCYRMPDVPMGANVEFLAAMGIEEAVEAQKGEEPIAYMISGSMGLDLQASFFHELKPETMNTEHHLYLDGDVIYDAYFDLNVLNTVQTSKLVATVSLNGESIMPAQPEKENALLLCRNVLESVQSASHLIAFDMEHRGDHVLNRYSSGTYASQGENYVSITHVPDDGSYHGYMKVSGIYYSNEESGWDDMGNVRWTEDLYPDAPYCPWLSSFRWRENAVTYFDTFTETDTKTVSLRIDEPMPGYEDLTNCYFVKMTFTSDGRFVNAKITVEYIWEDGLSFTEITEAIVTAEETEVQKVIETEWARVGIQG